MTCWDVPKIALTIQEVLDAQRNAPLVIPQDIFSQNYGEEKTNTL